MSQSEVKKDQQLEDKEIPTKATLIEEIRERMGGVKKTVDACIYKVPSKLRKVNEDAYNPRVVSIGPYHQENLDLVDAMKEHKWRYMISFLQQTNIPQESKECLERCVDATSKGTRAMLRVLKPNFILKDI